MADGDTNAGEPVPVTLKARWEFPAAGPDGPKREMLIELAFQLAHMLQPGFTSSRTRLLISTKDDVDELTGDSFHTEVYRLGDAGSGLEIADHVHNPNDGIVGISEWTGIKAYGLPEGCALSLEADFVAAQYERAQPLSLSATLPATAVPEVTRILSETFGARIEIPRSGSQGA